jgi:hypothetical protein
MYLLEMEAMGYNGGKSTYASRWKFDILPAFKDYSYCKQNRLWAIPQNATVNGIKIGQLLASIRTGHTSIPQMYLLEIEAMGYNLMEGSLLMSPAGKKSTSQLSKLLHTV